MTLVRIVPAGDVEINEDGTLPDLLTRAQYVRQKLSTKFKHWLGDWFLNRREGVPYREELFIVGPNVEVLRGLFRDIVRSEPQVARITRFDLLLDTTERLCSFDFAIVLTTGEVLVVSPDDDDFIITIPRSA